MYGIRHSRMGMAAGAGEFLASDYGDVMAWWDADDTDSVTTSGSAVTDWAAIEWNATQHTASQGTAANQPEYQYDSGINRYYIAFDGAAWLDAANSADWTLASGYAMFVAFSRAAGTSPMAFFSHFKPTSPFQGFEIMTGNLGATAVGTGEFGHWDGSTWKDQNGITDLNDTNWHIGYAYTDGASNTFIGTDGRDGDSHSISSITSNTQVLRIGADTNTAITRRLNGNIGEIIIYRSVLNTSQREAVVNYLSEKWGVTQV